jgi:ABC-type multidrug transport system ATPase subunit
MICYRGFRKQFGSVVAADGIDLEIAAGETFAVIGPNGSGKTTTLKAVVGLVRPSAGQVTIGGIDATTGGAAARRLVGYLPQRLTFPEGVVAADILRLYARLRGAPATQVDRLLDRVGLTEAAGRVVDGYSGGMRQRLGIAAALLYSPRALVLDEPSAALDPTGALMVRDLIREIATEGTTLLISSHDLGEVASLADRIAVFSAGRVVAVGSLGELEANAAARGIEEIYRRLTGVAPLQRVA